MEYRMRSFLGVESVRAANALAAAAGAGGMDGLRRELFAEQPPEHSGGFSTGVLVELGSRVGAAVYGDDIPPDAFDSSSRRSGEAE
jgi:hypothetical protein